MASPLNLFPARVPIGYTIGPDGRNVNVLMTREFANALSALLVRVGGTNGMGTDDLAALAESDSTVGQLLAMRNEVAELRAMLEQMAPALALQRQVDAMRVELAMIEDPAAVLRYILTRYAPLLSPKFAGTPTAPTAAVDTNTTQLATCEFTQTAVATKQNKIVAADVTGSRGGNAALASLLSVLATQGLINNSTTA